MKILVCGSRGWKDHTIMELILLSINEAAGGCHISLLMHGGARGADQMAGAIAKAHNIPVQVFPADWDTYGKFAGFKRNIQMLDENPDVVLAFWDGNSRGTAHTIGEARHRGIRTVVIT